MQWSIYTAERTWGRWLWNCDWEGGEKIFCWLVLYFHSFQKVGKRHRIENSFVYNVVSGFKNVSAIDGCAMQLFFNGKHTHTKKKQSN